MDVRKAALLVGALIIAIAAALMARSMFGAGAGSGTAPVAAAKADEGPYVLVATKPLPVGTILDADSFRFQPWPKELVENAYYIRNQIDPKTLQGAVVRTAISAGQPVTRGALIQPGERGFLAAALTPGMRAVTVPVSLQNSVAGFIFPGDRVDLLITQSIEGSNGDRPLRVSETIVRNLRVLATDQRTNALDADGKPVIEKYSNVTLEVTPKLAEKIAVAQAVGSLSLALRSITDSAQDIDTAVANGDIRLPQGMSASQEQQALARLASRPDGSRITYSTGADVLHFERSTLPQSTALPAPAPQIFGGGSAGGGAGGAPGAPRPTGPVVRVARGTTVTAVELGAK